MIQLLFKQSFWCSKQRLGAVRRSSKSTCFALIIGILFASSVSTGHAETRESKFQISLKDGSVFTASIRNASIGWTDVLPDGNMRRRNIEISKVVRLVLSDSPASQQVAEIRKYLNMLQGDDFSQREMAESRLSDPNIGGRFIQLIKAETENPKLEVRYRVDRILERLEDNKNQTIAEFDILELSDGSRLEGDAGDFEIDCSYREQPLTISRSSVRLIAPPLKNNRPAQPAKIVNVQAFQKHEGEFYQEGQTVLDFETAPGGSELARNTDVSELFIPDGILFGSEKEGYIGISGYGFNFPKQPLPRKNSICVFETVGRSFPVRFKGVMEMRFCMPNQRSVSAGVHELGFFIARVSHSRDFILEAYNADRQLLAAVEASDQDCVFMGVKSTEPICFVRVLSNPYLFRLKRTIDEDFAIDQLCFSPPVPVASDRDLTPGTITLKNGDLLKTQSLQWDGNQLDADVAAVGNSLRLPGDEVSAIRFSNAPVSPVVADRKWRVMLDDRSILDVTPGKTFASSLINGLKIPIDDISAVWFASNRCRFPLEGDFTKSQYAMVFPTCRLVSNSVAFNPKGYVWRNADKLEQQLDISGEKGNDKTDKEDPGPEVSSVDYIESSPEGIPTLWTKPPQSREAGSGIIRLVNGQQLIMGGSGNFQLEDINNEMVSVKFRDGQPHQIPLNQILSIQFPNP